MTADVNFDFQSRPVIITRAAWPPGIGNIGSGALALNPEHRRAKYMFLPWKVLQKVKRTITREVSPQDVLQATFLVFGVRRSLRLG